MNVDVHMQEIHFDQSALMIQSPNTHVHRTIVIAYIYDIKKTN